MKKRKRAYMSVQGGLMFRLGQERSCLRVGGKLSEIPSKGAEQKRGGNFFNRGRAGVGGKLDQEVSVLKRRGPAGTLYELCMCGFHFSLSMTFRSKINPSKNVNPLKNTQVFQTV